MFISSPSPPGGNRFPAPHLSHTALPLFASFPPRCPFPSSPSSSFFSSSAAQTSVCASGAAWRDRNGSTPQIDEPSDADLLYMAATLEPRHIWSGVSLLRNRGQLQPEPAELSTALKGSPPPASPSLLPPLPSSLGTFPNVNRGRGGGRTQ